MLTPQSSELLASVYGDGDPEADTETETETEAGKQFFFRRKSLHIRRPAIYMHVFDPISWKTTCVDSCMQAYNTN